MLNNLDLNNVSKVKEIENNFFNVYKTDELINQISHNPFTKFYIYEMNNKIVGILEYTNLYDRLEIVNFNVLDEYQNNGIGLKLINELIVQAKNENYENISLEVRFDNDKAIHIYEKLGFEKKAIRKGYYNGKDGILMVKDLK